MPVLLSDREAEAVARALDNYLPELSYDVARIDLQRDRHELAELERILVRLRERLREAQAAAERPAF